MYRRLSDSLHLRLCSRFPPLITRCPETPQSRLVYSAQSSLEGRMGTSAGCPAVVHSFLHLSPSHFFFLFCLLSFGFVFFFIFTSLSFLPVYSISSPVSLVLFSYFSCFPLSFLFLTLCIPFFPFFLPCLSLSFIFPHFSLPVVHQFLLFLYQILYFSPFNTRFTLFP